MIIFLFRLARLLVAGVALTGALSLLDRYFSGLWVGDLLRSVQQVKQHAGQNCEQKVSFAGFDQLPAPVARYLRFALREGEPMIQSVRVGQSGQLRISATKRTWRTFHAVQFICTDPIGFVWDAQVQMPFKFTICVRDSYISGRGQGKVSLFGVFPLPIQPADECPQLNAGELMRYLGEKDAIHKGAQSELEKLLEGPEFNDVKTYALVQEGRPADQIVEAAQTEEIDLIVIATHGLTGWRHLISGSVAEHVVRTAKCPVLVVPSRKPNDQHNDHDVQKDEF